MNHGTCVAFVLFHIFRYYKRIDISKIPKRELLLDLQRCKLLLEKMCKNASLGEAEHLVNALILRINSFGYDMKLKHPLRYVDIYDQDIIKTMLQFTSDTIKIIRRPAYKKFLGEIFNKFSVLHNLPRALLYDSSGDVSTPPKFHISKQKAMDCVEMYYSGLK